MIYIYIYIFFSANVINRTSPRDTTRPARRLPATAARYNKPTAGSDRHSQGVRGGVKVGVWGAEDRGFVVVWLGFEDEVSVVCGGDDEGNVVCVPEVKGVVFEVCGKQKGVCIFDGFY